MLLQIRMSLDITVADPQLLNQSADPPRIFYLQLDPRIELYIRSADPPRPANSPDPMFMNLFSLSLFYGQ